MGKRCVVWAKKVEGMRGAFRMTILPCVHVFLLGVGLFCSALLLTLTDQSCADVRSEPRPYLATERLAAPMPSQQPFHPGEFRLRQALEHYRHLAAQGGWPLLPAGATLRTGDRGHAVVVLQHRLHVTGDLATPPPAAGDLFDSVVEQAVRAFQQRHGLEVDGIVGSATRAALQVSVEERVRQLALHVERWHSLPEHLGPRYLLVNIPSFTLQVMENEQPVLSMRVVVGTPSRPTPLFRSTLTAVVLNPAWEVPDRITREEIVPRLRQEPSYLTTHHFTLLQGWGAEAHAISPHTIDWSQISSTHFPYRLRQEPGPTNALGRIKFIVPNPFHVFLHDTPSRTLFRRPVRAYSHGCIRLEKPEALAAYLLRDDPAWTRAHLDTALAQGRQHTIALAAPIPVYVIYHTAWVDTEGTVHFRPDIYAYDRAPAAAHDEARAIPCG